MSNLPISAWGCRVQHRLVSFCMDRLVLFALPIPMLLGIFGAIQVLSRSATVDLSSKTIPEALTEPQDGLIN
jgi:hypothetical protein